MKPQPIRLRDPRKDAYEEAKLAKRIRRQVGEAISDFAMIARATA
jgi:tRNA 2-thiocytidine biosynthesis protein TtcA